MPDRLQVWLHGLHVADLERPRRSDTRLRLRYTAAALERWPRNTPLVSCSLPLGDRPGNALPFATGLLPEGPALAVLAARARISVADTFGLLERYGRDIAGALVIGPDAPDDSRFGLEPYDEATLGDEVGALDQNPLGIHDDSELSLAGLQNKLLLVRQGHQWARPQHGRPSTHILKAEDRRYPDLARAEADCLALARAVDLTPVGSSLELIGGTPCLITERYDRVVAEDGSVARVHQEDLCQAVGVDGAGNRGRAKYQRRGGGGPGLREAASLLEAYADDALAELTRLVSAIAFTVAIGNADAHAKNLSFLHDTPTTIRLAPLYDTVPTILWANLTDEAAMSINGRFSMRQLTLADIAEEAASWPLDRAVAEQAASETIERVRDAARGLSLERLARTVASRCEALLAGRSAGA
jgi:serine/threonine-protein kinase HipA